MARRWIILAALTLARTAMAFQFQSIAAVGPDLTGGLGISYAALGTLIGLYLLPGAAVAFPGGWLGQRFGDKRMVLAALALMIAGGVLTGLAEGMPALMAGRLVSGIGGVVMNVLLTKMVADWFGAAERVTAMGFLIVSWPLGISLALVLLPALAGAFGWSAAMFATAGAAGACLVLVAALYQAPPGAAQQGAGTLRIGLGRHELVLAILAGLVWSLYNVGLISVLGFGPNFLVARGAGPVPAAATVSLVSWLIMPSLVLGGWLAARLGRPDRLMAGCLVGVTALIWLLPATGTAMLPFALIGLVFGPPAPLIVTLPAEVVRPENRGPGMGVFYTCYYLGMALIAPLAGLSRDLTGVAAAPLWFAGAMLLASLASLAVLRVVQRRAPGAVAAAAE